MRKTQAVAHTGRVGALCTSAATPSVSCSIANEPAGGYNGTRMSTPLFKVSRVEHTDKMSPCERPFIPIAPSSIL
jgi:hypothetical protein